MKDGSTTITYESVRNNVQELRRCANDMEADFSNFMREMNIVLDDENFFGRAKNVLEEKYSEKARILHEYTDMVRLFADSIETISSETEKTEGNIAGMAEQIASEFNSING